MQGGYFLISKLEKKLFGAILKNNTEEALRLIPQVSESDNINIINDYRDSFLSIAIRNDNTQIVAQLLKDPKIDISYKEFVTGETFLHSAARYSSNGEIIQNLIAFVEEKSNKDKAIISSFINAQDSGKNTPLHHAIALKNKSAIDMLLKYEADTTIVNMDGKTPLQYGLKI